MCLIGCFQKDVWIVILFQIGHDAFNVIFLPGLEYSSESLIGQLLDLMPELRPTIEGMHARDHKLGIS